LKTKIHKPGKTECVRPSDNQMAPKSLDVFKVGHEAAVKYFFVQSLTQTKQRTVVTNVMWLDQSAVTAAGRQQRHNSCSLLNQLLNILQLQHAAVLAVLSSVFMSLRANNLLGYPMRCSNVHRRHCAGYMKLCRLQLTASLCGAE
jgi:hypothetical protein